MGIAEASRSSGCAPRGSGRMPALLRAGMLLLCVTVAGAGCEDDERRVFTQLHRVRVLGAVPGVQTTDGRLARVCRPSDAADGDRVTLLDVALTSDSRWMWSDGLLWDELDTSIHPGDNVRTSAHAAGLPVGSGDADGPHPELASSWGLALDCVDLLAEDGDADAYACGGTEYASGTIRQVEHVSRQARRRLGHDVMLLIDLSGSLSGWVDKDTYREGPAAEIELSPQFGQLASDRFEVRLAAAIDFVETLNVEDRLGVLGFQEPGMIVPCASAASDSLGKLRDCFGDNRDVWIRTDPSTDPRSAHPIDEYLFGRSVDRSNLWEAVAFAWDFLDDRLGERPEPDTSGRTRQIVVITDGPDTSSVSETLTPCTSPASATRFADVSERVDALEAAGRPPIQVHFVQFESKGYPGRDPRQMELACRTGGHHMFINSNFLPWQQSTRLSDSLFTALASIRLSFMGHWSLALKVGALTSDSVLPVGTPRGHLYALEGALRLREGANLADRDVFAFLGVGEHPDGTGVEGWDQRPAIRKPCAADVECGAFAESDDCTIICSAETHTCPNGPDGILAPDGVTACTDGDTTGFCCDGACLPSNEQCAACAP